MRISICRFGPFKGGKRVTSRRRQEMQSDSMLDPRIPFNTQKLGLLTQPNDRIFDTEARNINSIKELKQCSIKKVKFLMSTKLFVELNSSFFLTTRRNCTEISHSWKLEYSMRKYQTCLILSVIFQFFTNSL